RLRRARAVRLPYPPLFRSIFRARGLVALHAAERRAPRADGLHVAAPREAGERFVRAARRAPLLAEVRRGGRERRGERSEPNDLRGRKSTRLNSSHVSISYA